MSDTPFSQMEKITDRLLKSEFPKALSTSYFAYAAVIVLTVGVCLLVYSVLKSKSAYISRYTTDMKAAYALMAATVVLAILHFGDLNGSISVAVVALALLSAVCGAAGVLLKQRFGPPFLIASLWLSLPVKEIINLPSIYKDYAELSRYNAASKMAVYAGDRMILGRIFVSMLIASLITVLYVGYFTKRRFYYTSAYEQEFERVSRCPKCLSPLVAEADYCSVCGESIKGLPYSVLQWKPLDYPKYCVKCGRRLNNNGDCVNCNALGTMKNHISGLFGMTPLSALKYLITCVLVAVIVFVPIIKGGLNDIVSGSAQISNTYVEKYSEWKKDPSVAENPKWLLAYDEASNELYNVNARSFDVNPDRLNYKDLYSFINYFEASYLQMAVLQTANDAVHSGNTEEADKLASYLNETLNRQEQALVLGLSLKVPMLKSAENIILDSGRFYLSYVPWTYIAAVLLSFGLLSFAAAVFLLLRNSGDIFKTKAVVGIPESERIAIEGRYKAVIKKERITALIGVALVLLIVGASVTVSAVKQSVVSPSYEACVHTVYTENGSDLLIWLSECRTNPENAEANAEKISVIVEDSIEKLELIIRNPDADADVVNVSQQLLKSMESIKRCIDSGILPNQELIEQTVKLLNLGMSIDLEGLLNEAFDSLGELF